MQSQNPKVSYWQLERYFNILRPSLSILKKDVNNQIFRLKTDLDGSNQDDKKLKKTREIFYIRSLIPTEVVLLEKIDKKLDSLDLPLWWRNGDTLRFAYINELVPEATIKSIQEYLKFLTMVTERKLMQVTLGFIANSNIYPYGFDRENQAILFISFKSKIKSIELAEFMELVETLFLIYWTKTCVPAFNERFALFLDFKDPKCSPAFITNFLAEITKLLSTKMPYTVGNVYLFGHETSKSEDVIAGFKMKMASQLKFKDITKENSERYIDPEVLQKRYGGYIENLSEYWPPRCLQDATKTLDENSFIANNIIPFTLSDSEYLNFERESNVQSPVTQRKRQGIGLEKQKAYSIVKSTTIDDISTTNQSFCRNGAGGHPSLKRKLSGDMNPLLNRSCIAHYNGVGIEEESNDSTKSRNKLVRNGRRRIIGSSKDVELSGVTSPVLGRPKRLAAESKKTPENQIIQDFRKKEGNFFTKTFYQFLSCCADR